MPFTTLSASPVEPTQLPDVAALRRCQAARVIEAATLLCLNSHVKGTALEGQSCRRRSKSRQFRRLKSGHSADDWSVITMEDWALIRRLAAEGVPKVRIAERLGVSRSTVIKAVASDAPPKYVRRAAEATSFTPFEARVRWLLDETLSPGIIPALAGSTAPSSPWTKHGPDHPRVGGEHCWMVASGIGGSGSSPRWRGAPGVRLHPQPMGRIIPALAGSTLIPLASLASNRDHPRVGGEHSHCRTSRSCGQGSSPRWRGARPLDDHVPRIDRIIPALGGARLGARRPAPDRRIIPALAGSTMRLASGCW